MNISRPVKPIFRQLLTGFGLCLVTVGFGTLWLNYHVINRNLERQVKRRAESITQTLQLSSEGLIELGYISMLHRVATNFATLPDVQEVAIVAPDGRTLTHNLVTQVNRSYGELHPELWDIFQKAAASGQPTNTKLILKGQPLYVEILPFSNLMFGDASKRGVAIAIINLQNMQREARHNFLTSSITLGVSICLLLVVMGVVIHRNVLSPLSLLNQAVQNSQNTGKFTFDSTKIQNEISYLAQTFAQVYQQLASYEQLEQEVKQRQEAETALRISEAQEREKAAQLAQALQDLQETQQQLIQTEKMSGLGQMVAGLAHEINNPVNFIYNNLIYADRYIQDLLKLVKLYQKNYPNPPHSIQDLLDEIEFEFIEVDSQKLFQSLTTGSVRIRDLVLSLRNFSRLDQSEQKQVDLHEGLDSTLLILKNRLDHPHSKQNSNLDCQPIAVRKNYGDLPLVHCYASQLNQVFMNLLSNAIDALDGVSHPEITIQTKQLNDQLLQVQIKDNGCGIPEEIRDRLFDPFFTTKEIGKGTGLGLSISYKIIVEQHQGNIRCESVLNQSTTFIIEIPISPV